MYFSDCCINDAALTRICTLSLHDALPISFGVMVAVRIKRPQTFTYIMQMLVMPMFFVSGAFFPVSGLPTWLRVLNRIDPLDRKSTRLNSSHVEISYAVFCLKKKKLIMHL